MSVFFPDVFVKFDAEILLSRLRLMTAGEAPSRWLVAFSGGMDSTVLLHALSSYRPVLQQGVVQQDIVAVHVDHGLHADSSQWEAHCRGFAAELQVEYICRRVTVSEDAGCGPEAAAREARYAALHEIVQPGDCLLSAHHEDDQAETLLLNLLRGSGLAGIAGIGSQQKFSAGRLLRPMLGISADAISGYAERYKLRWIDDPSNADQRFDRNFLRKEILPKLASRWPAVSARFKRSADLAGESSELLNDLADLDLQHHNNSDRLSISELKKLSLGRQRNVLRRAVHICGLSPPPASRIYQAVHELIPAREDAQPLVRWSGAELRRYRDQLFIMPELMDGQASGNDILLPDGEKLELGFGMGTLQLAQAPTGGIDAVFAENGLTVRYRQGGEEIRLEGHDCTHKLKKLLQQDGVLPWLRDRLPLLYADDKLVAVADFWIAAECMAPQGLEVRWKGRPALR